MKEQRSRPCGDLWSGDRLFNMYSGPMVDNWVDGGLSGCRVDGFRHPVAKLNSSLWWEVNKAGLISQHTCTFPLSVLPEWSQKQNCHFPFTVYPQSHSLRQPASTSLIVTCAKAFLVQSRLLTSMFRFICYELVETLFSFYCWDFLLTRPKSSFYFCLHF